MKKIFLILLVIFPAVTFAGTKEDLEILQRNVIDLQQQFWDMEKHLKTNSTDLRGDLRKFEETSEEIRGKQAALNAKLETILDQIQAINENIRDLNRRISEISSTQLTPGTQIPSFDNSSPRANDTGQGRTVPDGAPSSDRQPSTRMPGNAEGSVGEQQLFQSANAQYAKGKFEQSLRGFQDIIDQHPGSALADDAQYMIGEAYYSMKEYVDAVTEFDKVVKRYPDSENIPAARLKKAFALFELGKKGQGVVELQQIVQRYPDAKEAQIAQQRLAEFGLD